MAGIRLESQRVIYKIGQPLTALHLIAEGTVEVNFAGGSYVIGKGDVIGICELCSDIHFLEYVTTSEVSILTYAMPSPESLEDSFKKHPDVAGLFIISSLKQLTMLIQHNNSSKLYCNTLYQEIESTYHLYLSLCSRFRISPMEPVGFSQVTAFFQDTPLDPWLDSFYNGLVRIAKSGNFNAIYKDSSVSLGMLHKNSMDFRKVISSLEDQHGYQLEILSSCFCQVGGDLFSTLTTFYHQLATETKEVEKIYQTFLHIRDSAKEHGLLSQSIATRIQHFIDISAQISASLAGEANSESETGLPPVLINSLEVILSFAGVDLETTNAFREHIRMYKELRDRFSTEDDAIALRKQLTEEFNTLYAVLFAKTLSQEEIPPAVMMCLYFGYMDEQLAGEENCRFMYSLSKNMKRDSRTNIYTLYDWLMAIYQEEQAPSRNEFDQSYTEFIQKQKSSGTISDAEWKNLQSHGMSKVTYELRSMFPSVNKITYGRVATFCPIFVQNNVVKELPSTLVTNEILADAMNHVRKVDYSAYYRETLDTDYVGSKFYYSKEYEPIIILMPNVGSRGVMWQEIEDRNRYTPARMMCSIFFMEDLTTTMLRLTAEYRWEICKRIQGGHWNDIREKSLTSEYCDYVQFYRKNHDLTNDAKEKVRNSLQQARNSFKEMFVRDYLQWVMFEANGSVRLNKVARSILFQYCPFSEIICQKLKTNPFYSELLTKRAITIQSKMHLLNMLEQKLSLETQIKSEVADAIRDRLEKEKLITSGATTP